MQNNVCDPVWHEKVLMTSQKERAMNGSNALGAGVIFRNSALQGEASRGRKSWKVGFLQSPHRALFIIGFVHNYVCGLLSLACCTRFKEAWPCRCDSGTIKLDLKRYLPVLKKTSVCHYSGGRPGSYRFRAFTLPTPWESSIPYLENFQMCK